MLGEGGQPSLPLSHIESRNRERKVTLRGASRLRDEVRDALKRVIEGSDDGPRLGGGRCFRDGTVAHCSVAPSGMIRASACDRVGGRTFIEL